MAHYGTSFTRIEVFLGGVKLVAEIDRADHVPSASLVDHQQRTAAVALGVLGVPLAWTEGGISHDRPLDPCLRRRESCSCRRS